jgi:hypothetical protein
MCERTMFVMQQQGARTAAQAGLGAQSNTASTGTQFQQQGLQIQQQQQLQQQQGLGVAQNSANTITGVHVA